MGIRFDAMSSPSVAENAALALRELDQCQSVLADTHDWSAATPCDEWDVDALARHVAAVAWQQAEAFHRGRVGVTQAPSWLSANGERDAVLALLAAARDHLARGVDVGEDATIPMPFAPLPAPIAAAVLVLEYGVHRADLERALLDAPAARLDPFVARTVAGLLPVLVPILVEKSPPVPVTYRLCGDTATATVTYEDHAWRAGEGHAPVCEVHGSDAAVSLLALGRIAPDHPSLSVSDAAAAAALPRHIRRL